MTFTSLAKLADFSDLDETEAADNSEQKNGTASDGSMAKPPAIPPPLAGKFHPEFRFNIEVHLPSNGSEETYLNIFNALRKALA